MELRKNRKVGMKTRKVIGKSTLLITGMIITIVVTFPLLWLLLNSFKSKQEVLDIPPTLFPKVFTLANYQLLFEVTKFLTYFKNSFIVSSISSIAAIIIGILGVYSLSRFKFRFSNIVGFMILIGYMLPQILLVIPFMKIFVTFNMTNNLYSLTLAFISLTLPFAVWMLRSYIETIPIELEEAAMIDGASKFGAFFRIVIPAAIPGIVATFVFTFILAWNEYVYSLILISTESNKTITVGLANLIGSSRAVYSYGMLSAGSVLAVVPILIFFIFVQKNLISGFTAGAVKG